MTQITINRRLPKVVCQYDLNKTSLFSFFKFKQNEAVPLSKKKLRWLFFTCSLMLGLSYPAFGADVNGTNSNDILFYAGSAEFLSKNIVNPYSGMSVTLNDNYITSQLSYDGLDGIDTLLMTNQPDAFFLANDVGSQMLWNIERVLAGAGGDVIHLASATFLLGDLYIRGGASADVLWANVGNDIVLADGGNDVIDGGPGDDELYGGEGDDTVYGGAGSDTIQGGDGSDIIDAGVGDDLILGNAFSSSFDAIDGGAGHDVYSVSENGTAWQITLSSNPAYEFDLFNLIQGMSKAMLRNVEIVRFGNGEEIELATLLAPQYDCDGFFSPFSVPTTISRKAKGVIPIKMVLKDSDGYLMTDGDISAPPVINVTFNSTVYGNGSTDDAALESVGSSNDGNQFSYNATEGQWEYRLGTKQFSSAGTYQVTVASGDTGEYTISNGVLCSQSFIRQE